MSITFRVLSAEEATSVYDDMESFGEGIISADKCLEFKDADGSVMLIEVSEGKYVINYFERKEV